MAKLKESDPLPSEAQQLKDLICEGSARRPRKQCEKCAHRHFHWHEACCRWFLVVLDKVVHAIQCVIHRWRCVNCGATFRHLPFPCVAFKRYLRIEIEKRAEAYVEAEPMSYRKVVTDGGAELVYDSPIADAQSTEAEKEAENVPRMSHSTPYRWISEITASRERLQPVVKQAQQADLRIKGTDLLCKNLNAK